MIKASKDVLDYLWIVGMDIGQFTEPYTDHDGINYLVNPVPLAGKLTRLAVAVDGKSFFWLDPADEVE